MKTGQGAAWMDGDSKPGNRQTNRRVSQAT